MERDAFMDFDRIREYEKTYLLAGKPEIVDVPPMKFLTVRGKGSLNGRNRRYCPALDSLYGISITIRTSYTNSQSNEKYSTPLLEAFCLRGVNNRTDVAGTGDFDWAYAICLPDFATPGDFRWIARKSGMDFSDVEVFTYREGLCVQCVHAGSNDSEAGTVCMMKRFASERGYSIVHTPGRLHHEIYLNDPKTTEPARMETVIRYPVKSSINACANHCVCQYRNRN